MVGHRLVGEVASTSVCKTGIRGFDSLTGLYNGELAELVDGACLENRRPKRSGGSNPSLSEYKKVDK